MLTEAVGPVASIVYDHTGNDTGDAVAADAQGRPTRLLGVALSNNDAATACLVTIQDNAGSPKVLAGPFRLASGASIVLPVSGLGWGDSGAGKKIQVVQSANVRIAGVFTYQSVGSRAPS